jgi:hypothetical protein
MQVQLVVLVCFLDMCFNYFNGQSAIDPQLLECFRFTVHDITSKHEFLVSLTFEECWESAGACSKQWKLLENQRLPKKICNFSTSYNIPGTTCCHCVF